jgi:hypothetical protein
MTLPIEYYLEEYGPDFFAKLPKYKTARVANKNLEAIAEPLYSYVGLRNFNKNDLTFEVFSSRGTKRVKFNELKEFVL